MIQKIKSVLVYLIAVVCITSLFLFEFLNGYSDGFLLSKSKYEKEINNVKKALSRVKSISKNTKEYEGYLKAKTAKNEAKKLYLKAKKEEEVFGFDNKKIFLAQFGSMFCFLIYGLFMLFRSFKSDKKDLGLLVLHGVVLTGPIFYMYWIFQPLQDVNRASYYFVSVISTFLVVLAIYLITKHKRDKINYLQNNLLEVARFTFKNTKPEKREEMLEMIKKIASHK
ncbi:hypothetical protein [Tenacibaculum maritimum]|uniref:hypothetical protein n=1 Tax=Tenacibaculum maritimum TaxID=107401 RepID=UPI0012E6B220|nr:hypothetical protein [Tenacibaculum maritimum]CAA0204013.1 membrane hypothetical protein [Tenacibaculum maritimum]